MKHIFKTAAAVALMAAVLTACDDQVNVDNNNAKGGAAAGVKELGLVSDASGNVIVNQDIVLDKDTVYILHNYFRIQSGHKLTIEPGTVIKGVKKNKNASIDKAPGTIVIERGATIEAIGQANAPIVFTSNEATPATGDWGGVVVLGKADVNVCATCGASPSGVDKLGFIEGLPTPNNTGRYGNGDSPALPPSGSYNTDNSGILQYIRIEYAGDVIGTDNELNGLTLGGVGSGTTIDHIEVAYGFDDGFEWFGGTVNAKYLVSYKNNDDDFDTDLGFSGKIQFAVIIRDNNIAVAAGGANGFESNGDTDLDVSTAAPLTNATFANVTILGPITPASSSVSTLFNDGVLIRKGSELNLFNAIVTGFRVRQLELTTLTDFDADGNNATDSKISIEGVTLVAPAYSGFTSVPTNVTNFTSVTAYENESLSAASSADLISFTGLTSNAWSTNSRSLVADSEIPAVTSNNLLSSFFTTVDFRGAFGDVNDNANSAWGINTNTNNWVVW